MVSRVLRFHGVAIFTVLLFHGVTVLQYLQYYYFTVSLYLFVSHEIRTILKPPTVLILFTIEIEIYQIINERIFM